MKRLIVAGALLAAASVPAEAGQILLTPSSVIANSSYFTNCCDFKPGNVFDQQTGTVTETAGSGYWLAPDNGSGNAYITFDLGAVYTLSSLEFYNTSNGGLADRGTGDFAIYGSNAESGGTLITPSLILSGTLTPETSGNPVAQSFLATGTYRYLTFSPLTVAAGGTACCGTNTFGLNELRVFGSTISAVPEPATWTLMIAGIGMVGAALRRRRTATRDTTAQPA